MIFFNFHLKNINLTNIFFFQEAHDILLECARVLSFEPAVQPEGQLGIEAKDELKQMSKWIREEGWKQ